MASRKGSALSGWRKLAAVSSTASIQRRAESCPQAEVAVALAAEACTASMSYRPAADTRSGYGSEGA
jgi:hypothetical protein